MPTKPKSAAPDAPASSGKDKGNAPAPFADEARKADAERPASENERIEEAEATAPEVTSGNVDRLHRLAR